MPLQFNNDANIAGLIKMLDVDSDDTSSDEIPIECSDSFTNLKFSPFSMKKNFTIQNHKWVLIHILLVTFFKTSFWARILDYQTFFIIRSQYFKNSFSPLLPMKSGLSIPDSTSDMLPIPTVSAAVDARLELGVDVRAELRLKTMAFGEADVFFNAFFLPISVSQSFRVYLCLLTAWRIYRLVFMSFFFNTI